VALWDVLPEEDIQPLEASIVVAASGRTGMTRKEASSNLGKADASSFKVTFYDCKSTSELQADMQ
jgi:hypothetical protein